MMQSYGNLTLKQKQNFTFHSALHKVPKECRSHTKFYILRPFLALIPSADKLGSNRTACICTKNFV